MCTVFCVALVAYSLFEFVIPNSHLFLPATTITTILKKKFSKNYFNKLFSLAKQRLRYAR
jgi:hypothetical protein